jgi:L-fucose isomerase-like protein
MAIGVLALARATFDVPFAEEIAAKAFRILDQHGVETVGPRNLLFDAAAARAALETLKSHDLDRVLLLQVTFTDASMTVEIAQALSAPLAIWAFPEPRLGGRLRLNSFCGLNLAAHALGKIGRPHGWLYSMPEEVGSGLGELLAGMHMVNPGRARPAKPATDASATRALAKLKGATVGLIGRHPDGFDTCAYDPVSLKALTGSGVEQVELATLFDRARAATPDAIAGIRRTVAATVSGIDEVDQPQLDKSLSVFDALKGLSADRGFDALAVRCWPEMFTEYGCAACGPMGMMNDQGIPSACEADVYGAVSALMLQEAAGSSSWLVDIVDMDIESETGVLWHCGLAPLDMCDPATPPQAQIHSNRKMPLLRQFTLKPGRVTLARLSQAHGKTMLVVGAGTMTQSPMSFTGTSGVLSFDGGVERSLERLIGEGLEHHVAIAYGDHRPALRAIASALDLPILELTA